jgi:hypothetical protein
MGCSNTKEESNVSFLGYDTKILMHENINLLSVIEYLFADKNKQGPALAVMLIKKKTEEFYAVLEKYRQLWKVQSKTSEVSFYIEVRHKKIYKRI